MMMIKRYNPSRPMLQHLVDSGGCWNRENGHRETRDHQNCGDWPGETGQRETI